MRSTIRSWIKKKERGNEMKELNDLIPYITTYIYDRSTERIRLRTSPKMEEAAEAYQRAVLSISGDDHSLYQEPVLLGEQEEDAADRHFFITGQRQWELDIAIDCVRKMSRKERQYICDHPDAGEYHFGYAMWIRNRYIHPAKLHHAFMADNISDNVMQMIFSILIPGHDCMGEE